MRTHLHPRDYALTLPCSLKRELNLPPNYTEWATAVGQRLFARNEAFHVRARNELNIYRDSLLRLYPLSGVDLLEDLSTAIEGTRQSLSTARDLWYRVSNFVFVYGRAEHKLKLA